MKKYAALLLCGTLLLSGCTHQLSPTEAPTSINPESTTPAEAATAPPEQISLIPDSGDPPRDYTPPETTAPSETDPSEPEVDIGIAPEHLYPFVYTEAESWSWFREQLLPYDYVSGYLYVENSRTDSVTQILNERVITFTGTSSYLYCITEDGRIVQTDYIGELCKELYTYTKGYYPCIEYQNGRLVFMDGFSVIIMDAITGQWQDVGQAPGMVTVFPASENYLLMKDPDGKFYGFDIRNGKMIALTTNRMIDDLWDGYWPGERPEETPEVPATEPEQQEDGTPSWYPPSYTSQSYDTFF